MTTESFHSNVVVDKPCQGSKRQKDPLSNTKRLPADHIRLLRIVKGDTSHAGTFELCEFPRLRAPSYTALSYEWGDGWGRRTRVVEVAEDPSERGSKRLALLDVSRTCILIDGSAFLARPNLGLCLDHIRQHLKTEYLWIDAICINQTDDQEKNIQVREMGTTYHQAEMVIAWLGLPDRSPNSIYNQ